MMLIRRLHGWLGVLFAPSLVLFCLSGIFQMYGCHEGEGGDEPAGWVSTIAQVHMHQVTSAPRRRPRPPTTSADAAARPTDGAAPATADRVGPTDGAPATAPDGAPAARSERARAEGPGGARPSTGPIKAFFLLMSLALIGSSALGVYIALMSKRDRNLHVALLAAGFVIPIVLLLLA